MPADKMNDDPIKKYIAYWDDIVKKWFTAREKALAEKRIRDISEIDDPFDPGKKKTRDELRAVMHSELDEEDPFLKALDDKVDPLLMPEPYWGDPRPCRHSVVIADYNPAGNMEADRPKDEKGWRKWKSNRSKSKDHKEAIKEFEKQVKKSGYESFAKPAPVMMSDAELEAQEWSGFKNYGGRDWWKKRKDWIKNVAGPLEMPPFAMEFCGWHSKKWTSAETGLVSGLEAFQKLVMDVFVATVENSTKRLGICIGKDWNSFLERQTDRFDCEEKLECSRLAGKNKLRTRMFRRFYLKSGGKRTGATILATWAHGSNKVPGSHFNTAVESILSGQKPNDNPNESIFREKTGVREEKARVRNPVCKKVSTKSAAENNGKPGDEWTRFWNDFKKTAGTGAGLLCDPGANDGIRIIGRGTSWFVQFSPNGSDMKLEVHATDRAGKETLKRRVSTLPDTTLPGAWKKCRIGGRGSLAVASFKMNAFDKARPDFDSMVSAGKSLLAVLQGGR